MGGGNGPTRNMEEAAVVIPDGVSPGESFTVKFEWGGTFEILCPDDNGPGDTVRIE